MNRLLVLLFLVLTCSCATSGAISEDDVQSFVESVDTSFVEQDVSAIGYHLADSANVVVEVNGQKHIYSKQDYLALLEETWRKVDEYSYEKMNSNIDIQGPNSAVVKEEVVETVLFGAVKYVIRSSVNATVRSLDGRLVATHLSSVSEIQK